MHSSVVILLTYQNYKLVSYIIWYSHYNSVLYVLSHWFGALEIQLCLCFKIGDRLKVILTLLTHLSTNCFIVLSQCSYDSGLWIFTIRNTVFKITLDLVKIVFFYRGNWFRMIIVRTFCEDRIKINIWSNNFGWI